VSEASTSADVAVEVDGHVAVIEIRRPPNNFFDVELIAGIADLLDELAGGDCRVAVLASQGRHFCAGANFSGGRQTNAGGPHLYEMAVRLFEQPLPIVAAVQGAAIGGGFGLAMAADFRVASPEARFSANFARLGFHHGFGLSVTLPLVAGHQTALDLLYTGRRIDGEEALQLGIADRLVANDELRQAACDLATEIAGSAPLAVRSIRQTMRGDLAGRVRDALVRERSEQDRLTATQDWREGVAAMAERRPPVFTGS
jgi:2-(1,2-epoxy-1,2-dihydrophenyl)acetyl-CoA isomerase